MPDEMESRTLLPLSLVREAAARRLAEAYDRADALAGAGDEPSERAWLLVAWEIEGLCSDMGAGTPVAYDDGSIEWR